MSTHKEKVEKIQSFLKGLGYVIGLVDGILGNKTLGSLTGLIRGGNKQHLTALQEFLKTAKFYTGLIDGVFGVISQGALYEYLEINQNVFTQPLGIMLIRTARLASRKGAMFGVGVRTDSKGNPRNHQGLDLAAEPNTPVYAVADGRIDFVNVVNNNGYGKVVVLEVDVSSLPDVEMKAIKGQTTSSKIYIMYAHLNEVDVGIGQRVTSGHKIGVTGNTGNARSMTTKQKGAHLHIELRTVGGNFGGMVHRLDPLLILKAV